MNSDNNIQQLRRTFILNEIDAERIRQLKKWGRQHRENGTSTIWEEHANYCRGVCDAQEANGPPEGYTGGATWFSVLREEFFEAAAEENKQNLRKELIQVAAVAVAWIEDLDSHVGQ